MPNVLPLEVAEQFLLKYKEYKKDSTTKFAIIFTDAQVIGMTNTLRCDPLSMTKFYSKVLNIIVKTILNESDDEDGDFKELSMCLIQYTQVMTTFLGNIIGIISMNSEQKTELQHQLDIEEQVKRFSEKYGNKSDDIYKNLDFKLPDLDKL